MVMALSITLKRRSLQFLQHVQYRNVEYMITLQDTRKNLCIFILYYKKFVFHILSGGNNPVHLLWHHVFLGNSNFVLFLTVYCGPYVSNEGGRWIISGSKYS